MKLRLCVALAAVALAATAALAQDPPANLPDWAPSWEVGDWWEVRTFQKDLREELSSPAPAEGATPRIPEDPRTGPLPNLPPLRNGIPEGYKAGNRFRLTVARREEVRYPDDVPGTDRPEAFWVIALQSREGSAKREAELWYAAEDLSLAKVVLDPAGEPQETWFEGSAQLSVPLSQRLGFPLDWPDLPAARRATGRPLHGGRHAVEQRVRKVGEGAAQEVEILLQVPPAQPGAPVRVRTRLSFSPGKPFWTRIMSGMFVAELVATSDD